MVDHTFLDLLCHIGIPTLEILEFGYPNIDPTMYFATEGLTKALEFGLPRVYAVGFAEVFVSDDGLLNDDVVDDFLLSRAESTKSLPGPPGVYYI